MDDGKVSDDGENSYGGVAGRELNGTPEPVRSSRWTPKPEQILILESIFNSGMVNPAKDETIRIRKLLERFGVVGDTNVFYWFQNRRSRSRRRQRQIQAAALPPPTPHDHYCYISGNSSSNPATNFEVPLSPPVRGAEPFLLSSAAADDHIIQHQYQNATLLHPNIVSHQNSVASTTSSYFASPARTSNIPTNYSSEAQRFFSHQQNIGSATIDDRQQYAAAPNHVDSTTSLLWPCGDATSTVRQHSGTVVVYINGVASEVPREPINIRLMFGQDAVLVHSSGQPLPVNEFGMTLQSLQSGGSYFLMSRPDQLV